MERNETTLVKEGNLLILSSPLSDNTSHFIKYGAIKKGKKIIKIFPVERFHYLKEKIDETVKIFKDKCDFISGMSGYSSLSEARCNTLGIRLGAYEQVVVGIQLKAINTIREKLPKVRYGLVYGSSNMGVDLSIQKIAHIQNIPLLGFTCLDYLWYVSNDTKGPDICIFQTSDEYCYNYVHNCDLLMAANGGSVSYDMDIMAATKARIPVIPVDVLRMLGSSVPAFEIGNKKVNDAVGALLHTIRLIGHEMKSNNAEDRYERMSKAFSEAVTARVREVVPVEYAY